MPVAPTGGAADLAHPPPLIRSSPPWHKPTPEISSGFTWGVERLPLCVDDFIPETDLTVARALDRIPQADRQSYAPLYQWFQVKTGIVGSRHMGELLPGIAFKHAAQRGTHAPTNRDFAATVTVRHNSLYEDASDGQRFSLGDGMWVVYYSAHRNNTGGQTQAAWNAKLFNCMAEGVPVDLFLQTGSSAESYLRALVFVEEYDAASDLFTLHGLVTETTEHLFASRQPKEPPAEQQGQLDLLPNLADIQKDDRKLVPALVMAREGQQLFRQKLVDAYGGRCAETGTATHEVLQAAHILDYRGTLTNAVQNGLLLRSDFDNHLIGINPSSYRIEVARNVSDGEYTELDGKQLLLPKDRSLRPNEQYLAAKYERFRCA